jgi:hypothetical protein
MGYIKNIPNLKEDNYIKWKRKLDLAFILGEVNWIVTTSCPTKPEAPVRGADEADAAWQTRKLDFASVKMSYDLDKAKLVMANKKCLAVIKNTIEPALVDLILDYDTVAECLERIKSQFSCSSKIYASQLVKQLITEKYTGGGIREHILKINNQASNLKPMDLALKEEFFIHLVFASLPKEYDTFVVN